MPSVLHELTNRVQRALNDLGLDGEPSVRASTDQRFGDYQSNAAMAIAKRVGKNPRQIAEELRDRLNVADLSEPPEIAGAGFVNFRLRPDYLAQALSDIPSSDSESGSRMGIPLTESPKTVVIDLSSPNLAKEMHVGHLRSTVIGDCVARLLEFHGHTVIRENHVGDWGTQFGMLLAHLRHVRPTIMERPDDLEIHDLETFYIEAKARFDIDEEFKKEARETVVALQRGDEQTRLVWRAFCDESLRHCHAIYQRLGVRLVDRGESFYTDLMNGVVKKLETQRTSDESGTIRESNGALCIFLDGFKTRDGEPLPLIVRKSDGGFNYATSDLATIVHRVEHLHARRVIYVVGLSQKQHFEMLFAAARSTGLVSDDIHLEHLGFGNMLAASGKPFKTREGGTIKLKDLLDEAVARARRVVVDERADESDSSSLSDGQKDQVAETVGLAAIKYFDLSHALTSDYRFDIDTMVSLEGNTAPYMLYAYARVQSIGRKAGVDFSQWKPEYPIVLEHPSEIDLAKQLARFWETLDAVIAELRPNVLTEYLYDLSKSFSRFYDKKLGVRVIDASPEAVRISRLRLCDLTARTLKMGLTLLGINTLDQM
ncbi:MAG: arginine--tRNA ligase [Planctomycetota bacterium]